MGVYATEAPATGRVQGDRGLRRRVWARLAAASLDARLRAGEDPRADAVLACRSRQLVSRRTRVRIAGAVERVCSRPPKTAVFSAAIPVDWRAVEIARPALEQLASALRSRESVRALGVALTQMLLTDGTSALYRPAHPEELYEVARRALLTLGPVGEPIGRVDARGGALVMDDQLDARR
jgi:hypothetical protein